MRRHDWTQDGQSLSCQAGTCGSPRCTAIFLDDLHALTWVCRHSALAVQVALRWQSSGSGCCLVTLVLVRLLWVPLPIFVQYADSAVWDWVYTGGQDRDTGRMTGATASRRVCLGC
jgi:hypothetical protein